MSGETPGGASQPVSVTILDREYLVACEPHERASLLAAAAFLDGRMRDLRAKSRGSNPERVAVMAGLTLAHEFLELGSNSRMSDGSMSENVASLHRKLDGALAHFIQ